MRKTYSIVDARNNFARVVHEAEDGLAVELTRRGKSVAVILSIHDYQLLTKPEGKLMENYQAFRKEHNLEELDIDPDEVYLNTREKQGRNFSW